MSDRTAAEAMKIARLLVQEAIRRERARQCPAAVAGRVTGRVWRSIVSGGWD